MVAYWGKHSVSTGLLLKVFVHAKTSSTEDALCRGVTKGSTKKDGRMFIGRRLGQEKGCIVEEVINKKSKMMFGSSFSLSLLYFSLLHPKNLSLAKFFLGKRRFLLHS